MSDIRKKMLQGDRLENRFRSSPSYSVKWFGARDGPHRLDCERVTQLAHRLGSAVGG